MLIYIYIYDTYTIIFIQNIDHLFCHLFCIISILNHYICTYILINSNNVSQIALKVEQSNIAKIV